LRQDLEKIKQLEIELKRMELQRAGLDPYDSPMSVDEVFKIASKYDADIRKLDGDDATEQRAEDDYGKYDKWVVPGYHED
jgi:hypothetical protein